MADSVCKNLLSAASKNSWSWKVKYRWCSPTSRKCFWSCVRLQQFRVDPVTLLQQLHTTTTHSLCRLTLNVIYSVRHSKERQESPTVYQVYISARCFTYYNHLVRKILRPRRPKYLANANIEAYFFVCLAGYCVCKGTCWKKRWNYILQLPCCHVTSCLKHSEPPQRFRWQIIELTAWKNLVHI